MFLIEGLLRWVLEYPMLYSVKWAALPGSVISAIVFISPFNMVFNIYLFKFFLQACTLINIF